MILEAERKNTLSPAEAAYLRRANAEAATAAAIRDARIRRVATATARFAPSDAEDRAAVSAYWDSVSEVYASDDPVQQTEAEFGFVNRTRALPQALEAKYRGALLSKEPAVVVLGAEAIARLAMTDPALVQGIPADEVRRARAIATYAALGVEADLAVEHGNKKVAAESARTASPTRSVESQVAAADEPSVMSDATVTGAPDESATGVTGADEGDGVLPDGSAALVDPETGEQTTVDGKSVERVQALARDQATLTAIREQFLEIYESVASKEMTREEAASALRAILDAPDGPVVSDPALRKELERVTSDILYAADREAAFNVFTERLLSPKRRTEIGREVLSLLPVAGEVVSAVEAYEAFAAAIEAWQQGNTDEALRRAGEGGLATLGTLPLAGETVRLTRGGIKVFRKVRPFLVRGGKGGRDATPQLSRAVDELPQGAPAAKGPDKLKDNPFPDRILVTDTEYPFTMIRKKRYTTNKKQKKLWEQYHKKPWPIDPETGRDMVVHHIIPFFRGGPDSVHNIMPMNS